MLLIFLAVFLDKSEQKFVHSGNKISVFLSYESWPLDTVHTFLQFTTGFQTRVVAPGSSRNHFLMPREIPSLVMAGFGKERHRQAFPLSIHPSGCRYRAEV